MKSIRIYSNHKDKYCLMAMRSLLIFVFSFAFSLCTSSASVLSQGEKVNVEQYNKNTKTFLIGLPEEADKSYAKSMEHEERYVNYLILARQFQENGDYEGALTQLNLALVYVEKNNLYPVLVHKQLAGVYEAMRKEKDLLRELNWLIENVPSQKAKQGYIERRQKLLGNYS